MGDFCGFEYRIRIPDEEDAKVTQKKYKKENANTSSVGLVSEYT
jgi:hypothetical protein